MPGSDDILESVNQGGTNMLTSLRDNVDPICGGAIARCLLTKTAKTEPPVEAVRKASAA